MLSKAFDKSRNLDPVTKDEITLNLTVEGYQNICKFCALIDRS